MKNTSTNNYSFVLVFVVTTILVSTQAYAQDKTSEIDKIFNWTKPNEPGCAVAASQNGKVVINRAYGSADLERDVPISPNTVFDAGSVRKQFVAAAILLLVEEGKLSLADDVRKHIPQLPDYGHKITVDHLLTHTSGIRDWQTLLNLAGGDPDAMTMILRQRETNFVPGDEWAYSNSNYVLLPEIVTRVSGMPFSEFARKRLFEPLGMKSTTHPEDPLYLIKNRALAYKKEAGAWKMDMYLGNDRGGAGGLFTTAADLVTWNDALSNNRLGAFVTKMLQEPATLNNGRKLNYARGLNIELRPGRGGKLVWHSGGAAGYSALAGYLPEHGLSVAIMCNLDGGARSAYASRVFDLFLPPDTPSANTSATNSVAVAPADLSGRAGLFFDEKTGQPLQITVNNNNLAIAGGGPLVALAYDRFRNQRPTLFFMSGAEFELQFLSTKQIEIKTKDGITTQYRRAEGYSPTGDDLRAFTGRYYSDELMAVFEATPGKDSLMVRANDSPRALLEFKPVTRDTFQIGASLLRFNRDKAGKVVGLEYSNPLLRNVKFARLNDRTTSR
ncbi:MAG TPA: serine hydrolase domain-containing protein [Blastocatellia bacterium]|nr:serine hydrolase domain-containing protein [Blastocatellia bacterium]